jgi:hypothetical protein
MILAASLVHRRELRAVIDIEGAVCRLYEYRVERFHRSMGKEREDNFGFDGLQAGCLGEGVVDIAPCWLPRFRARGNAWHIPPLVLREDRVSALERSHSMLQRIADLQGRERVVGIDCDACGTCLTSTTPCTLRASLSSKL